MRVDLTALQFWEMPNTMIHAILVETKLIYIAGKLRNSLTRKSGSPILSPMRLPSLKLRGFKQPREVLGLAFGKLEREVMEAVWERGEVSVRDIYVSFQERIAYTTVMTTLGRLYKKGLLERRLDGRAFYYSARVSSEQFGQVVAKDVIGGLLDHRNHPDASSQPILACIVDAVTEHDRGLLDELDRLVKEKRKEFAETE
jgi:predicted transcriptional regulator